MRNAAIRTRGRQAAPANLARIPGSRDMFVGANGQMNASDIPDLMRNIGLLMQEVANGNVSREPVTASERRELQRTRQQTLTASYYSDRSSRDWSELGAAIGSDVAEVADREGFMRRLMMRTDVANGSVPRIRVRQKNVMAVVAASAAANRAQHLKDNYFNPPEYYIKANIRVEERELVQGSGDILEDKFFEAQEAIMVAEDRKWKQLADDTIGLQNEQQILAGGLTPMGLSKMRTQILRWNIPAQNLIIAADIWDDIIGQPDFSAWFDPVSQHELITTGTLGTLLGMSIITDAFRHPQLRVLRSGEMYVVSNPELHGTYTDRGPVQSNEVNDYPDGSPSRGWMFHELLSTTLHNSRSVVKGIKQ